MFVKSVDIRKCVCYNQIIKEGAGAQAPKSKGGTTMKPTTSRTGEYEVAWQEFDRNDRLVTKTKTFKTEEGRAKFIERVSYKASFYCIYGTRDAGSTW